MKRALGPDEPGSIDHLATATRESSPLIRPGFITAAAFLLLVAGIGAAVVVPGRNAAPPSAAVAPTSALVPPVPTTTDTPDDGAASSSGAPAQACTPVGSGQKIPTAPLPNVTWDLFDGIAEPFSSTDGPARIDGDLVSCYAHTPDGALIAAMQISERHLLSADWQAITMRQVAPGPGRDKYLAMRAGVTLAPQTGTYPQWAGFSFVTYSPAAAVVQLAVRFPDGGLQMTTDTVVWSGGDWWVQLQPDGSDSPTAQPLHDLVGFVVWGGI